MNKLLLATISVSAVLAMVFSSWPAFAYVMQSSNFRLQQDSINVGGTHGDSASFKLEDTAGEIGSGYSTSTSFIMSAGYQQNDVYYVSISAPEIVTMTPKIDGLTGGSGNGAAEIVVRTNNIYGYTLYVNATSTPAMKYDSYSFADYSPLSGIPDYSWSVDNTTAEFGFTPEGPDIVQRYRDSGGGCNSGTGDTPDKCWDFFTTGVKVVSMSNLKTDEAGTTTTIKFKTESGNQNVQPSGIYTAHIIITAVAN